MHDRSSRWPLALLVATALLTAACGGSEDGQGPDPEALESDAGELLHYGSEEAARLGLSDAFAGDLDGMLERDYIRALVAYSKTSYMMDGLQQRGVAYELLQQFEQFVNEEYADGVPVRIIPIPATRAEMFAGLREGRGDIALGGLTITEERREVVDFSDPFMTGVAEIVVTHADHPTLDSVDDLSGSTIYVRESSSYFTSLQHLNGDFAAKGLDPIELIRAEEYLEDEDLIEMVNSGLVEAIVVDRYKAEFWDQIFDDIQLQSNAVVRAGGQIAWAFRQDSPQLEALVNRFVADHRKGTLMGNMLFNRYLRDTTYVENVMAGDSRARYVDARDHFRTFADQYGFDYLLMLAQGYQESKLDQSLVSRRGAVGIMQLLPSTAADAAVGIPDISTAENNIHAGIRYMRWIRDTYFNDPDLDPLNATLLSFASYNAGPNRIRRLRAETEARGLDPDVWFRNVEFLAAEDIGRETVSYVENIYKYYAAYRLMIETETRRDSVR